MQSLLYPEYALVSDLDTAIARARAGAAYLDRRVAPGWDPRHNSLDRPAIPPTPPSTPEATSTTSAKPRAGQWRLRRPRRAVSGRPWPPTQHIRTPCS